MIVAAPYVEMKPSHIKYGKEIRYHGYLCMQCGHMTATTGFRPGAVARMKLHRTDHHPKQRITWFAEEMDFDTAMRNRLALLEIPAEKRVSWK